MKLLYTSLLFLFSLVCFSQSPEQILEQIAQREREAEALVEQQLRGYNASDMEMFLAPYSEDIEVYTFPDVLKLKGKDNLREAFTAMFINTPNRKATILKRIVYGSNVIDHEEITGLATNFVGHTVALYVIENHKIAKVYFMRQDH